MNDLVESSLGNPENVGIYQKTFGDQAEAACRTDHKDNVLYSFNWVLGGAEPATPDMHIAYKAVFDVAIARGAPAYAAGPIAATVVMHGDPTAFLHGTHAGIEYGVHSCHMQSAECPLASPHRWTANHRWERLSYDGECSPFGAMVYIDNNTSEWIHFDWIIVFFKDSNGFVLDKLEIFDQWAPPETVRTVSDSKDICGDIRDRVVRSHIELAES